MSWCSQHLRRFKSPQHHHLTCRSLTWPWMMNVKMVSTPSVRALVSWIIIWHWKLAKLVTSPTVLSICGAAIGGVADVRAIVLAGRRKDQMLALQPRRGCMPCRSISNKLRHWRRRQNNKLRHWRRRQNLHLRRRRQWCIFVSITRCIFLACVPSLSAIGAVANGACSRRVCRTLGFSSKNQRFGVCAETLHHRRRRQWC